MNKKTIISLDRQARQMGQNVRRHGIPWRCAAMAIALWGAAGCASPDRDNGPRIGQAADASVTQASAIPGMAPVDAFEPRALPASQTTAAQLEQLLRDHQVTELRTVYNGAYGAHLFFQSETLSYYVALTQKLAFWRVVELSAPRAAQSLYEAFAAQSKVLADVEIRNLRVQAQSEQALQQLEARDERLRQLQADQQLRTQQDAQVAQQQAQSRQTWQILTAQQRDVERQLRAVQGQINALQAEQIRVGRKPAPRWHRKARRHK